MSAQNAPRAATVTLRALEGEPLADEAVSRTVVATAHAIAERTGVVVLAVDAQPDRVTVTTSGGDVEARWLVGADGLHGRVRTACRFAVTTGARRRVGMRRHFRIAPWSEMVEVHWGDGVEA